jgi:hypothetical protein
MHLKIDEEGIEECSDKHRHNQLVSRYPARVNFRVEGVDKKESENCS